MFFVIVFSCKGQNSTYVSFGDEISADNASGITAALVKYQSLKTGDSIDYKLRATVN